VGWIFGAENQAEWTQKIFKQTFRFQNPLRKNYKHLKALEAALDVSPEVIHSVVVFAGDSTFKSPLPTNVTSGGGYITYIKNWALFWSPCSEILNAVWSFFRGYPLG